MDAQAANTTLLMRPSSATPPDWAAQEAVRAATAGIHAPADAAESRRFGAVLSALSHRDGMMAAIQLGGASGSQGGVFRLLPTLLAATRALAVLDRAGMYVLGREELLGAVRWHVQQSLEALDSPSTPAWVVAARPESLTEAHVASLALTRMGRPFRPWPQRGIPDGGRFIVIGEAEAGKALAAHPRCDGMTTLPAVCDSLEQRDRCA